MTLTNSTVSGNTSSDNGGGIRKNGSGTIILTNSTVSGNTSTVRGGGIYTNFSVVTLMGSTISGNTSTAPGGGIYSRSGAVTLTNSTVSRNTSSGDGGGISSRTAAVALTNSTVSGNSTTDDGGGIHTYRTIVMIANSTITGNTAGGVGGGIGLFANNVGGESLTVRNSIIAGNSDNGTAPDLKAVGEMANSQTVEFSLIGNTTGANLDAGMSDNNIVNVDPLLGDRADNGGPTQTHALLPGSPAVNAGDPNAVAGQNGVPATDQRGAGFVRVSGGRLDMGSFESQQTQLACDVDSDVDCDVDDIDLIVMEISAGTNNITFDLTGDGNVDLADRNRWLAEAGALNLASGNAYLLGDANLDGFVDVSDFNLWNSNNLTSTGKWSQGDFNADGFTDVSDFNIWNSNNFTNSDSSMRSSSVSTTVELEGEKKDRRDEARTSLIDGIFAALD